MTTQREGEIDREFRRLTEQQAALVAICWPRTIEEWRQCHRWRCAQQRVAADRDAARWEQHIATLARQHRITVRPDVVIASNRGYAFTGLRAVEIEPVVDGPTYCAALHEVSHCLRPCEPSHTRVRTKGTRTCCVRCEIRAWREAIRMALTWTPAMHASMAQALSSYRTFATAAEVIEIDRLCARTTLRREQLTTSLRLTTNAARRAWLASAMQPPEDPIDIAIRQQRVRVARMRAR